MCERTVRYTLYILHITFLKADYHIPLYYLKSIHTF